MNEAGAPPGETNLESGGFVKGVAVALVTDNKDPDGLGRVKVRYPWHSQSTQSYWARIASPMAGKDRGTVFYPEVGDEVLVVFDREDLRFPYVLGGLWNGKDPILKERLFGLTNAQGNHGEDVKELYF